MQESSFASYSKCVVLAFLALATAAAPTRVCRHGLSRGLLQKWIDATR